MWAGLLPRGGRIVMATVILTQVKERATRWIEGDAAVEH
jgi:hypothetical protein